MKRIREAGTIAPTDSGGGKRLLTLITPGRGSSGVYTAEMLARAAEDRVFPRGTQGHIDHTSRSDEVDRPEGSLRNLALYLDEDARWEPDWVDPESGEKGRLAAEAFIGSEWRNFVDDFQEIIGVSISSAVEVARDGSLGRLLPDPFNRTDLVTVAGRGGRVGEALEAARAIESRVQEATSGDLNSWLSSAVRATHGAPGRYVWFEDFDEQFVFYSAHADETDSTQTYRQKYSLTGSEVALTGEPEPVHRRTEYDPVNSPTDPAGVAQQKEAATMATIDDQELAELRDAASRTTALEAEITALKETAKEDALKARKDAALALVKEAFGSEPSAFYVNAAEAAAAPEDFDAVAFEALVREAAAVEEAEKGAGDPGTGSVAESAVPGAGATSRSADDIINALG